MNRLPALEGFPEPHDAAPQGLADLASLEARVDALLPSQYHSCADPVDPASMGSAGLRFGPDGAVAWGEIWTSFCDLALAGGPPHRGSLLEPPAPDEAGGDPDAHRRVVEEIARGVRMTAGLDPAPGAGPGWVAFRCRDEAMASWLLRAVTAENVLARRAGDALHLPAGPRFLLGREVKNVVVALAKTCHYWDGHLSDGQKAAAAMAMGGGQGTPPLEAASLVEVLARADEYRETAGRMALAVEAATAMPAVLGGHPGWVTVRCPDEPTAGWFLRAAVAENVLARREAEYLCLPVPVPVPVPVRGGDGVRLEAAERFARLHRLWTVRRCRPASPVTTRACS